MLKLIFTFITCFYFFNSFGQYQKLKKDDKVGVVKGEKILVKPRFDSLEISEDSVITTYRKNRIKYFNPNGDKIYSGPIKNSQVFEKGLAIVQKRSDKYFLINKNGDKIIRPQHCLEAPKRFGGQIIIAKPNEDEWGNVSADYFLYSDTGLVEQYFHAYTTIPGFLITSKKPIFQDTLKKVYNVETDSRIEDEVVAIDDSLNHLFLKRKNNTTTLYNKRDFSFSRNHGKITILNETYFYSSLNDSSSLYKWEKHQLFIKTACDSFAFNPHTIYAIGNPNRNGKQSLEIYNLNGQPVIKNLQFVIQLDDDRWILGKNDSEFIATETGQALSKFYTQISPEAVNGYRVVYKDYRYTYINDATYQELPVDLAVIFRENKYANRSHSSGGLIKALVSILVIPVAAVLAPLTRGKSMQMLTGSRGYSSSIQNSYFIITPGNSNYFSDGMTIINWYGYENDSTMVTANYDAPFTFNFIDTAGNFMNDIHYQKVFPFQNGKTWVKEQGKEFQLINKKGEKASKLTYDEVELTEGGFYICRNEFTSHFFIFSNTYHKCYLYNEKHELVHKGNFTNIYFENGAFYGGSRENPELIYRLYPE